MSFLLIICLYVLAFIFCYIIHRFLHEGCFWGQTVRGTNKESPLVSMHERPLIVPATLQYSRLSRHRRVACEKGQPVKSCFSS